MLRNILFRSKLQLENTHITEKQPQRSEHFGGLNSQNYNKCHLHLIKQVGAKPSQTQVKLSYNWDCVKAKSWDLSWSQSSNTCHRHWQAWVELGQVKLCLVAS